MAVFKCKMCGGTLEVQPGESVAVCDSCGSKQTIPNLSDDRRASMYDRANHFRRNNEFDKASGIYEQILNEDSTDAEAYWSLVLCRYGIEYVEDPETHKMMPTVNRTQYTSIFADEDYKAAIANADDYQKVVYEAEAKAIDEIQKGILAISQKEEPFDVFISFKETDANGRRTPDSVLANDLYHQLTQEGFKVFFAPITLEDKLGSEYEPYIFAALNSAKVMVVLGTKPEHFNAVWVKNEWSRYLNLIKNGAKKTLVPAYKDMDPYDLPEEFSHLMAQDMSKLGFMQDLVRGIKKISAEKQPKAAHMQESSATAAGVNAGVSSLLERAFMFLEDEDWENADEYCEKVLDIEPKNALAYLGKLMADVEVSNREKLQDCEDSFEDNGNYAKAMRFGGEEMKNELDGYIRHILDRNEEARLNGLYNKALDLLKFASSESDYRKAAECFKEIKDYRDSEGKISECLDKAETAGKNAIYSDATGKMAENTVSGLNSAITGFKTIQGWKDSDTKVLECEQRLQEVRAKEERDRLETERVAEEKRIAEEKAKARTKKIIKIVSPIAVAVIAFLIVLTKVIIPNGNYNKAVALYSAGQYKEAITAFKALDGYKDSADQIRAICHNPDFVKQAEIGDLVFLGRYEQDNDSADGAEEIEWVVLDKKDNKLLLISKFALYNKLYNEKGTAVTWETCTLRKWLNNDFYNSAFSDKEKKWILKSNVTADINPSYSTDPGKETEDSIFLLSINEAEKYFGGAETRRCAPTAYAIADGAYTKDEYKTASGEAACRWWLRSPGGFSDRAANVNNSGYVDGYGMPVASHYYAVRPALWINLDS